MKLWFKCLYQHASEANNELSVIYDNVASRWLKSTPMAISDKARKWGYRHSQGKERYLFLAIEEVRERKPNYGD